MRTFVSLRTLITTALALTAPWALSHSAAADVHDSRATRTENHAEGERTDSMRTQYAALETNAVRDATSETASSCRSARRVGPRGTMARCR